MSVHSLHVTRHRMNTNDTVQDKSVVSIDYTLKDASGEILDSSDVSGPTAYLHGANNIVPGLEQALTGKSAGTKIKVEVSPQEGYGERIAEPFPVERTAFPEDLELTTGMQFVAEGEQGLVPVWVDRVEGDSIYVDPNHPLAGQQLFFDVTIVSIRAATPEELENGHVQGPGEAQN